MAREQTIRVYKDPSSVSPCAGCSAHIRWHDTLTGKRSHGLCSFWRGGIGRFFRALSMCG